MKTLLLIVFSGLSLQVFPQAVVKDSIRIDLVQNLKFNYKQLIVPAVFIGYGLIGIESDQLKLFNSELRDEVTENIDEKVTVDDFMQYAPAASVFALNAFGVEGKSNPRDRSVIIATSFVLMSATVLSLKAVTQIERPDGTSKNSFPSGHTAMAFAGAEFLMQEYKQKSVWYGISGYAVATATGIFRMYNNRHWLTDVVAGAGIGILSTKAAYWLNPYLSKKLFAPGDKKTTSVVIPFYDGNYCGLSLVRAF
jgi:hypothetical protein